ncbi:MAG TPA: response regulator transcription factor [Anaerolineales bacterium]|nr:response regulator transcription factor [Anaerolineales bacterium]
MAEPHLRTPPGHILIVDDEPALRTTLTRVLITAGWEVTSAAEGRETLQLLAASAFDLVYLDIHLFGMSGLELLQQIRATDADLPVVLFTGKASLDSALEAIRLGASDYLVKPIDPEILIARTRVILEERYIEKRRRVLREQIDTLQGELAQLDQRTVYALPAEQPSGGDRFVKRGSLVLDLHARRATFRDTVLELTPASFDYLLVLSRHTPEVVDYRTLVNESQGYETSQHEARELVKWHIHNLRRTIERDPQKPQYILNVRGVGYRLLVD